MFKCTAIVNNSHFCDKEFERNEYNRFYCDDHANDCDRQYDLEKLILGIRKIDKNGLEYLLKILKDIFIYDFNEKMQKWFPNTSIESFLYEMLNSLPENEITIFHICKVLSQNYRYRKLFNLIVLCDKYFWEISVIPHVTIPFIKENSDIKLPEYFYEFISQNYLPVLFKSHTYEEIIFCGYDNDILLIQDLMDKIKNLETDSELLSFFDTNDIIKQKLLLAKINFTNKINDYINMDTIKYILLPYMDWKYDYDYENIPKRTFDMIENITSVDGRDPIITIEFSSILFNIVHKLYVKLFRISNAEDFLDVLNKEIPQYLFKDPLFIDNKTFEYTKYSCIDIPYNILYNFYSDYFAFWQLINDNPFMNILYLKLYCAQNYDLEKFFGIR